MSKYLFDGHKLIWHMDRVHAHFRDNKRIYPLHIDIGVDKCCNAKCIYCYGIFQKMTNEMIPSDILYKLFDDAPKLGIKSLVMTGDGEPSLNKGVWDAIRVGKYNKLDIGFATNGIALDSEKKMCLMVGCTWVRFNLSAVNSESYKLIHGVDKWSKVKENIETAVATKKKYGLSCTIGLQMVLIPQCADQILAEAEFAVKTGVDYFVIKQFSDPNCKEMSQFNLSWYDNPVLLDTLKKAEAMSTDRTKIIAKWGMIASKGVRPYDHCVDCPLLFQISGSGKCYPCGYLFGDDRYCYGDLNKQSLKEILDSEHYWNIIKYMREEFDVHKQCSGCCRHDATNAFIWEYINEPYHINFI